MTTPMTTQTVHGLPDLVRTLNEMAELGWRLVRIGQPAGDPLSEELSITWERPARTPS